jgi:hypothetical protein
MRQRAWKIVTKVLGHQHPHAKGALIQHAIILKRRGPNAELKSVLEQVPHDQAVQVKLALKRMGF